MVFCFRLLFCSCTNGLRINDDDGYVVWRCSVVSMLAISSKSFGTSLISMLGGKAREMSRQEGGRDLRIGIFCGHFAKLSCVFGNEVCRI